MKTEKKTVRLEQIRPNPNNPRKEFGDLDALADAIRATGGEPVNPIVVVEDEDRFIIVDGERRYRALSSMYDGSHETDVLVVDDYSAAAELVAMLATDDKLALTDAERAQGFQLGLILGVPDEPLAQATRTDVQAVKGARSVWRGLSDDDRQKYQQATIDQLAKAAEYDGKDRDAILKADPNAWTNVVRKISARQHQDAIIDALMDKCAEVGIEWREKVDKEDLDDLAECHTFWFESFEPERGAEVLAERIVANGATVVARSNGYSSKSCVILYGPKDHEETPEEKKQREAAALYARRSAAKENLKARVIRAAIGEGLYLALSGLVLRNREKQSTWLLGNVKETLENAGVDKECIKAVTESVSSWDAVADYLRNLSTAGYSSSDWPAEITAELKPYGFEITEEDEWLIRFEAESE